MSPDRLARRPLHTASLLLAGLMLLLLGACSQGDSPAPSASAAATTDGPSIISTRSKSPTAAPVAAGIPADVPTAVNNPKKAGEKPPIPPASGYGPDDVGSAINFAKFFIETIDWAGATTNPAYMKHYFEASCTQCQVVADSVTHARVNHYRNLGGRITVRDAEATNSSATPAVDVTVDVRINVDSLEQLDAKGRFVTGVPAQRDRHLAVDLKWNHARWSVVQMTTAK